MSKLTARLIEERHKQFEAGDAAALLDAVDLCARSGTAMPEWLANAFCERYLDWCMLRAKTLDDAFRVKRPKNMRVGDRARRERLKPRVVLAVLRLRRKENLPFGEELFERAGATLKPKITGSLARDVFYDPENRWRDLFRAMPPKEILDTL
jgi:hypothetical protein